MHLKQKAANNNDTVTPESNTVEVNEDVNDKSEQTITPIRPIVPKAKVKQTGYSQGFDNLM